MRKCEAFPARSPWIRHRKELIERECENAVQGLGKFVGSASGDVGRASWFVSRARVLRLTCFNT